MMSSQSGLIKIRSRLGTQFMAFFRLIARILTFRDKKVPYVNVSRQKVPYVNVSRQKVPYVNVSWQKVPYVNVSRQKVPYFNVSRQNRVIFDCFATKQCWGMLKYRILTLSGSLWLTLALSGSLSGSLWLSLARCPTLSGSLWLSQALYCSPNLLTKPLLGSQGPCSARNVVPEFPHFNQPWHYPTSNTQSEC